MRINEVLSESTPIGKPRKGMVASQKGITKSRDIGGYDRVYHMNRLLMAAAMADGQSPSPVDMDSASWAEKYNTMHPYTKEEDMMFRSAMNTVPTDKKKVTPWSKSKETDTVSTVSPVAQWMKPTKKEKKAKK